ncbi:MAG: hypothetical protein DHS80DRAFT_33519 [Piptocephalis tieghemiana]|nr:MAG: hypothetical protein DHS80DRAFT_33519 [Piptocephalis tieghemiana]
MKLLLSTLAIATMLVMPLAIIAAPADEDNVGAPEEPSSINTDYTTTTIPPTSNPYEGRDSCSYDRQICWGGFTCRNPSSKGGLVDGEESLD